jgi:hypothetical protein
MDRADRAARRNALIEQALRNRAGRGRGRGRPPLQRPVAGRGRNRYVADPDVPARVEVPAEANQRQPALQPQRIQLNQRRPDQPELDPHAVEWQAFEDELLRRPPRLGERPGLEPVLNPPGDDAEDEVEFVPVPPVADHRMNDPIEDDPFEGLNIEEMQCTIVLSVCGFRTNSQQRMIRNHVFSRLSELLQIKETDLRDSLKNVVKVRVPEGEPTMTVSLSQLARLIGLMHYVQDFERMGMSIPHPDPNRRVVNGLAPFSLAAIDLALERSKTRENHAQHSQAWAKANNPGNLSSGQRFREWDEKFINFLSGLPGVTGIPLHYVIRDEKASDDEIEQNGRGESYLQILVAKAPLYGPVFQHDAQTVHGYLRGFLIGQPAEHWNKELLSQANGRSDMLALRAHYGGSGNTTTMLAEAKMMYDTLVYRGEKNKGTLERFLTDCQKMFILFDDNDEPMTRNQKVKFVLDKKRMQAPSLQMSAELLRVQQQQRADTDNPMTFVEAANLLTRCMQDNLTVPSTVRNQIAASSTSASRKNNGKKKGNKHKHSAHANVVVPGVGPIGYMKPKVWRSKGSELQKKILAEREKRKVASSHTTVSESSSLTAPPLSIDAPTLERMVEVCAQRVIGATRTEVTAVGNAGNAFGGRAQAARDNQGV